MRKGYTISNGEIFENDECILVDNDNKLNEVSNLPLREYEISEFTDEMTIGVWKIKKLNETKN